MKTGLVHGRFQPPHNGHIRYMLAALARAEYLLIGICTPLVCTEEDAARTGYPCAPHLNPFTFDERVDMITLALTEAGVSRDRYTCIPFPSDYKNISTLLPKDTVFLMSVTGENDAAKIAYIQSLGFAAEVVMSLPQENERERSGTVRESAHTGSTDWESIVPKSVAQYIREHKLLEKVTLQNTVLK